MQNEQLNCISSVENFVSGIFFFFVQLRSEVQNRVRSAILLPVPVVVEISVGGQSHDDGAQHPEQAVHPPRVGPEHLVLFGLGHLPGEGGAGHLVLGAERQRPGEPTAAGGWKGRAVQNGHGPGPEGEFTIVIIIKRIENILHSY